jgi:hypothetical protein
VAAHAFDDAVLTSFFRETISVPVLKELNKSTEESIA